MKPQIPQNSPEYAQACLEALADQGLGNYLSLGGAFGLMHYYEYRTTHDVDAWWQPNATPEVQKKIIAILESTLGNFGSVRTRVWGEVVSVELHSEGKQVFSFQIARRSAQLNPSTTSPWEDVLLDSFDDLVANKMIALVERGAPRDFLDIYRLCSEALITPSRCWLLWSKRQQLAGSDTDHARARLAVLTHLARIEQHRPLENITNDFARAEAERVRMWFNEVFVDDLS
jgi:hypothetical protein